jgi:hypothetical protein
MELSGLRPMGEYEFRVFARNADGVSEPSRPSAAVLVQPMTVGGGGQPQQQTSKAAISPVPTVPFGGLSV